MVCISIHQVLSITINLSHAVYSYPYDNISVAEVVRLLTGDASGSWDRKIGRSYFLRNSAAVPRTPGLQKSTMLKNSDNSFCIGVPR